MSFAALDGLTDSQFNCWVDEMKLPKEVFVYRAPEFFFKIGINGTATVTPKSLSVPEFVKTLILPVVFDVLPQLKQLKHVEDHVGMLVVDCLNWTSIYVDGRIVKGKPVRKQLHYYRVKSYLMPKLRKLFKQEIKFTAYVFNSAMTVPNGCAIPVLYNIERIAKGLNLRSPSSTDSWKFLQRLGNFFQIKGENVAFTMVQWNKMLLENRA